MVRCQVRRQRGARRLPGGAPRYRLARENLQQRLCEHKELIYLCDAALNGALHWIGTAYGTTAFRNPAVRITPLAQCIYSIIC